MGISIKYCLPFYVSEGCRIAENYSLKLNSKTKTSRKAKTILFFYITNHTKLCQWVLFPQSKLGGSIETCILSYVCDMCRLQYKQMLNETRVA